MLKDFKEQFYNEMESKDNIKLKIKPVDAKELEMDYIEDILF